MPRSRPSGYERSHHMLHLTARRWSFGSDDFALTATYILGVVFLTAMFGAMATDWDVQSIM
eukprot:3098305-Rhodomonas_salina.1